MRATTSRNGHHAAAFPIEETIAGEEGGPTVIAGERSTDFPWRQTALEMLQDRPTEGRERVKGPRGPTGEARVAENPGQPAAPAVLASHQAAVRDAPGSTCGLRLSVQGLAYVWDDGDAAGEGCRHPFSGKGFNVFGGVSDQEKAITADRRGAAR